MTADRRVKDTMTQLLASADARRRKNRHGDRGVLSLRLGFRVLGWRCRLDFTITRRKPQDDEASTKPAPSEPFQMPFA
jgi:hypothetical protein